MVVNVLMVIMMIYIQINLIKFNAKFAIIDVKLALILIFNAHHVKMKKIGIYLTIVIVMMDFLKTHL